jgi:hypothetical protein
MFFIRHRYQFNLLLKVEIYPGCTKVLNYGGALAIGQNISLKVKKIPSEKNTSTEEVESGIYIYVCVCVCVCV